MATYQFIFKPKDINTDQRLDVHFVLHLVHALWNEMSHHERDDRRQFILCAVESFLNNTEMSYSEIVVLADKILNTVEAIFDNVNDLIMLMDTESVNYSCTLESLLGHSLVININTIDNHAGAPLK